MHNSSGDIIEPPREGGGGGSPSTTAACSREEDAWYIIPCPSTVKLVSVHKERGTHGSIYALWECDFQNPVWIGQSIPALVKSINSRAIYCRSKRLHASSLYRCIRRESKKQRHKSFCVEKFSRSNLCELNKHISLFPSVVYVSKAPEMWHCGHVEEEEEEEDYPQEQ